MVGREAVEGEGVGRQNLVNIKSLVLVLIRQKIQVIKVHETVSLLKIIILMTISTLSTTIFASNKRNKKRN